MARSTLYPFKEIEKKIRRFWTEKNILSANLDDNSKRKFYSLVMLPYPSGKIHMGHVRNYVAGDLIAQLYRMLGFNVIHPIGWDAHGMPAENAAIENGVLPLIWTKENIAAMKETLQALGLMFNWNLELSTCSQEYYEAQIDLICEMFEAGLLERRNELVNWDPVDKTVLANEQVINGRGWRSNAPIEKKPMFQWFFKITKYAEQLLNDLDKVQWPQDIVSMQKNWIGKSIGCKVNFKVLKDNDINNPNIPDKIEVFTTTPETLHGGTFIALSIRHPLAVSMAENPEIQKFLTSLKTEDNLQGVFTGLYCLNEFNNEKIPVWIANYVLEGFGSSAIYGCPNNSVIDGEFAKRHNLKEIPVINDKGIFENSGVFNGLSVAEAHKKAMEIYKDKITPYTCYRLQDWCCSRTRIWGCPIPMAHCNNCGHTSTFKDYNNHPDTQTKWRGFWRKRFESPIEEAMKMTLSIDCVKCGGDSAVETDTLDTFVDSSWYFLRYISKTSDPIDKKTVNRWMPVDLYIGGAEHAVLHLLYARFFTKVLRDLNHLDFDEPFHRLVNQGMVCMQTFRDKNGRYVELSKVIEHSPGKYVSTDGEVLRCGSFEKMSKSKKNGVCPNEKMDAYGSDAVRLFIISDTPLEKDFNWNENSLRGCWKFLNRLWDLQLTLEDHVGNEAPNEADQLQLDILFHNGQNHLEKIEFNTYVSCLRVISNKIEELLDKGIQINYITSKFFDFIRLAAPVIPHISEEIFQRMKTNFKLKDLLSHQEDFQKESILQCSWIKYESKETKEVGISIQVNGKFRGDLQILRDLPEDELVDLVCNKFNVRKLNIRKVIYIPNRTINLIILEEKSDPFAHMPMDLS